MSENVQLGSRIRGSAAGETEYSVSPPNESDSTLSRNYCYCLGEANSVGMCLRN